MSEIKKKKNQKKNLKKTKKKYIYIKKIKNGSML